MAKLQGEHVLTLTSAGILERGEPKGEDDGRITLREPTNKEWNDYDAARFEFSKKGRLKKDNQSAARSALFDKLAVSVDDIEDDMGPLTVSDLERIPARYKQRAIFLCFEDESAEDDEGSIEKN